ncbi:sucrose phosphorylase [Ideonella livida]|uniref:Sucrose phosphorylase n=1 Tax=Ideonella livida TaxID=2707176 RepID=A0A7C9TLU5_9BURK|nr:sucrose phosphorylase [Ideonella livida]NDY91847.1 sucrose phosphorylase [Ideonella livida]
MNHGVQLITYVDRFGRSDLRGLQALLRQRLPGVFAGVHLLPFFHSIHGADAGFDPIDHLQVDATLGGWDDVRALAADVPLMADVIVNHMSSASPQFQDFLARGEASAYAGLFLSLASVFPQGATEADLLALYRPRPGLPFTAVTAGGQKRLMWTTFTAQQMDIDVATPAGQAYLDEILRTFADAGISMIRLDAVGYAVKKAGTSSFMLPETFDFIAAFAARGRALGLEVLVEVHSHFAKQVEIAQKVDWVYDFALPPLVLHALCFGRADRLAHWLDIRPHNAITVLDTHDGIGIIDIGGSGAGAQRLPGLVPDDELDRLVDWMHDNCAGQSREATGAAASNVDLYQVNCTFYDALGADPRRYLLARALQFFTPGVPQVYYVGLLAGRNDMDLLRQTRVGRDINRHHYTPEEVDAALAQPVVQAQLALIALRNRHPAFAGTCVHRLLDGQRLQLRWTQGAHHATLTADLAQGRLHLDASDAGLDLQALLPWLG